MFVLKVVAKLFWWDLHIKEEALEKTKLKNFF